MARKPRHLCSRCEQKISEGHAFCKACGYPTQWASHDEKVEWELAQYERARHDGAHTDFERMQTAPAPARRAAARSRPAPAPAAEPVISVKEFREQRAGDVAIVRRADKPAPAKPAAPSPSRSPAPSLPEPSDTAVLVKVMRLLNARISELEARIAELESEPAPHRRASSDSR
jgi:hypothetical protein